MGIRRRLARISRAREYIVPVRSPPCRMIQDIESLEPKLQDVSFFVASG